MIDYARIGRAVDYYQRQGYKYIEVPWIVSPEADLATKPKTASSCKVEKGYPLNCEYIGHLVASGEQSFIQMMMDYKISNGRYVCVTPCFRAETRDELHQDRFMKVELINADPYAGYAQWTDMILDASKFFWSEGFRTTLVNSGEKQVDIVQKDTGIELGSYGFRTFKEFNWIYGTGLAEPRTTIVKGKAVGQPRV